MTDQGPEQHGDMPPPMPPSEPQPMPPSEAQSMPPAEPQPPPPFPGSAPSGGIGTPADLVTRFLARLIDSILLSIVLFVVGFLLAFAAIFSDVSGFSGLFGGFGLGAILWSIIYTVIFIGYFAGMESQTGQTFGKMAMGIKTQGPDGNKPTMNEAIKRNAWYALGIVPFIGGLAELAVAIYIAITINNSPTRTGWHDTFAGGTSVVKAR